MKIAEFLKKYAFNAVTGTLTVLAYKDGIYTAKEKAKFNATVISQKDAEIIENNNLILKGQERWNILKAKSSRVEEIENLILGEDQKLEIVNNKITNKLFTKYENELNLKFMQKYYENEKARLIVEKQQGEEEIRKYISGIDKSYSFDWVWDLVEQYKEFTSSLNLEQLVALYNIIGYFMVCSTLLSIFIILASDYLIQRFKLEEKLPKFATILKARARISKVYLKIYIIMLIIIILINISVNIYMFIIAI
jgi:hypothetical protein